MNPVVFDYSDYKAYIRARLDSKQGPGKGARTRLCEQMGCRTAYLSQVLNGAAQLSIEQADAFNRFAGHSEDESEYFLLLVQNGRAGTESLRQFTQRQMEKIRKRRSRLKSRLGVQQKLSYEHQSRYYSSWLYPAIHVLVTIPQFRTPSAIARRLSIELTEASRILDFLVTCGLLRRKGGEYEATTQRIHLGDRSDLTARAHLLWRMQAMRSVERGRRDDLHYSSAVTLSRSDVQKIREILVRGLESAKSVIRDSDSEELHCLSVDWFTV